MKKIIFLIAISLLLAGCASAPEPPPPAPPPPPPAQDLPPPVQEEPRIQETQQQVYGNRHSSGILLDGAKSHTVRWGDTLNRIARTNYQDGSLYPLISMVNGDITDVDLILPGTVLIIPDANSNLNDPAARAAINSYFPTVARLEEQRGRSGTAALIRNHIR